MKVFVIIPAYNEETKIVDVLEKVKQHCRNIIVVDDGSSDDTLNKATSVDGITVLSHCLNRGQGAALQTGTDFALALGADYIVHFDSDGQMNPAEIKNLFTKLLQENAGMVKGSRFLGTALNMPWARRQIIKAAGVFTLVFSGIKMTDPHNGFRIMNRRTAQKIKITQDRMAHASEILDKISREKIKCLEIPSTVTYTQYSLNKGQSSWGFIKICRDLFFASFKKNKKY